jgi:hypothetical protein
MKFDLRRIIILNDFEIVTVTITKIPSYINEFWWNIITGIFNIKKIRQKLYKLNIFNIFVYGLICVLLSVAWLGLHQNHVEVHCNSHAC